MTIPNSGYIINESSGKKFKCQIQDEDGNMIIGESIIQVDGQLNRNNRVYPHSEQDDGLFLLDNVDLHDEFSYGCIARFRKVDNKEKVPNSEEQKQTLIDSTLAKKFIGYI